MNQITSLRRSKRLTGPEKSAILFLCLGETHGGALMQQLEPDEIRRITRAISAMGEVPSEIVEEVMREFGQKASDYGGITGSIDTAKKLLQGFLSEDRVSEILDEIQGSATGDFWGDLSALEAKELADYLRKEHNQTVAVILTRLKPAAAAKVLPLMGQERSVDLVQRMLAIDELPASALRSIEDSLRRDVLANAGRNSDAEAEKMLVQIFNKLDNKVFEELSIELEEAMPEKLRTIKQQMFVFDDLVTLKPADLAKVMREVTGNTLPMALRGAKKNIRDTFLEALPARSRDMLQDEMTAMGAVRARDAKQAQSDLVEAALRLADSGTLELPSADEEEEMVD